MPRSARQLRSGGAAAAASAYESYYGLAEPPFSLSPAVRFVFKSRSFAAALGDVRRALDRREGLIVVSGEIGTGKTMLCRAIMQQSDAKTFVSLVLDPCLTIEEMLAQVLSDFGVVAPDVVSPRGGLPGLRYQLLVVLQRFLASLAPLGGRAVVIIDEAQHLQPELLEQIRLWSNLEGDQVRRLQIVLAGQPELDQLLDRPDLRQVKQRVSRHVVLARLRHDEVAAYLAHRLKVARGTKQDGRRTAAPGGILMADEPRVRFTPMAARSVAALTRGIPRLVNLLADRALEVGCERQASAIDVATVRAAARRLNLAAPLLPQIPLRVAAAAAAITLVAGSWGWNAAAEWSVPESEAPAAAAAPAGAAPDSLKVSIASFRTAERAAIVATRLVEAGYPAFTRRHPDGTWHQVIVGPFVSAEEAAGAQRTLQAQGVSATEVRLETTMADGPLGEWVRSEPARRPRQAGPKAPDAGETRKTGRAGRAGEASETGATGVTGATGAPSSAAAAPEVRPSAAAYQTAIQPAVQRLDRLVPFLVSATASPDVPVLKALGDTLTEIRQVVGAVDVPDESRHVHGLLSSAIAVAATAVDPAFAGDRAAQTRQALSLLGQAKAAL